MDGVVGVLDTLTRRRKAFVAKGAISLLASESVVYGGAKARSCLLANLQLDKSSSSLPTRTSTECCSLLPLGRDGSPP